MSWKGEDVIQGWSLIRQQPFIRFKLPENRIFVHLLTIVAKYQILKR
jgi:hypothetical protein